MLFQGILATIDEKAPFWEAKLSCSVVAVVEVIRITGGVRHKTGRAGPRMTVGVYDLSESDPGAIALHAIYEILSLGPDQCIVQAAWLKDENSMWYPSFENTRERLVSVGTGSEAAEATATPKRRGPTDLVRERALVFRRIKGANPGYSYSEVARAANLEARRHMDRNKIADHAPNYREHDVRNAYRAMREAFPDDDWTWRPKRMIR